MTGWRTFHGIIVDQDLLPSEEEITQRINSQCNHSRTRIYRDELYILVIERDSDPLIDFAKEYANAFSTIGIGRGDDTGAGNDDVKFYDVQNGKLNKSKISECPTVYNGLRVESTR